MNGRRRTAGALVAAGAVVVAFGGGVVSGSAQDDPKPTAPSGETGRQPPAETTPPPSTTTAPAPAPAPAPPAETVPEPSEIEVPAPPPPKTKDETPKSDGDEQDNDGKDDGPARSAPKADAAPRCAPKWFVRRMTEAERRRYHDDHPKCAPDAEDDDDALREPDGTPTESNPTFSLAELGAAPIGVPNFFIEKFRIPPFLLSIYQAAGIEYGIRWEILAAINEIETDYGRNLNVSSAGAVGWMQFMPATWKSYGVDANRDGKRDPYNPVDAIFAAANYLKAAGAEQDLRKAIFAYNHADWYVDSVLLRARLIGGLPADLVGSLTGLTQGRFPVHADATYADDLSEADTKRRVARGRNAAITIDGDATRRSIRIFADTGAPVIASQDGKVVKIGRTKRLGRFVQLRDVYGNTYTYAKLGSIARSYPVPKDAGAEPKARAATERSVAARAAAALQARESLARVAAGLVQAVASTIDPLDGVPAEQQGPVAPIVPDAVAPAPAPATPAAPASADDAETVAEPEQAAAKQRLYANPRRPRAFAAGGREQLAPEAVYTPDDEARLGLDRKDVVFKRLKVGSNVVAGTTLGRVGRRTKRTASHLRFEIRPAGRGAPRIDPKPILDGWKLLESTAIYRAKGRNPFFGKDGEGLTVGQILLMSKQALQRRVLENPRVDIYECGRRDIRAGIVDRRVLATLEFLAASGLRPTVTSLRCGHSYLTASGNVSHHSSGSAVDIAKINGIPVLGHQGAGSVTEMAVRRLLTLQGTMKPSQIISLMTVEGADNTLALPDHADHIHVGWQPLAGDRKAARQFEAVLKPEQWLKLIDRLNAIENPTVPQGVSDAALPAKRVKRASRAHVGD